MATGPWVLFDSARLYDGNGTIDWDTDSFKVSLHPQGLYAVIQAGGPLLSIYSEVSGAYELATLNGYTAGGSVVTMTYTKANVANSPAILAAATPVSWLIATNIIEPKFAIIRKNGTAGSVVNPLVAYCDLNNGAAAAISVAVGQTLTINFQTIFTKVAG